MDTDLSTQMAALSAGKAQFSAQIAVIKKQHEMEMELISMLDAAQRPAPAPAGQGRRVDKTA